MPYPEIPHKVHLDTDLGGDLDDLCALALLLRWQPAVQITGITVVGDTDGRRTGMVHAALQIAGRAEIPVAAGADTAQGYYPYELGLPPEARYWPQPIIPSPNPPEVAVALLRQSIGAGATVIAIGPLTNLRLLEETYPGTLAGTKLCLMGGYVDPPRAGFPTWTHRDDFNVQVDARSAKTVLQSSSPTLTTLAVTVETALRHTHLDRLWRSDDPLARLIARQAEAFAVDEGMATKFGTTCAGVPDDIINFQHDPLACAVALGWDDGVRVEELTLRLDDEEGWLRLQRDRAGRVMRVVTEVDGARFSDFWLDVVAGAGR
jgi:inosine-uridine nucleoside N-ribohydrolase